MTPTFHHVAGAPDAVAPFGHAEAVGWVFVTGTRFEEDFAPMNAVYSSCFPQGKRPARTWVGVTALAKGARVEIDFVARR